MGKRYILLFSFLLITSFRLFAQNVEYSFTGREGNVFYHTVEQGQNVYRISIMYQVSEEDIYRLNPSSRESIKIGEKLKIPQKETFNPAIEEDIYVFHTIQPGETMYGVSKKYNLTAEQLTRANMGLTPQTFAAGKTIRIPADKMQAVPITEQRIVVKEIEYTVKRRETMYSITRTFKVTNDQLVQLNPALKKGLKAGMVIKIPVETVETVVITPNLNENDFNVFMADKNKRIQVDNIKIALMLPFQVSNTTVKQARTEFYEGLLMAFEELKSYGITIDLSLYDIGEGIQTTRELVQNEQLPAFDLIIGGETNEQIELIASYALRKQIRYVVPFSQTCERLTANNAYMFQLNTPAQILYSYATSWACSLFLNHNIIFVNTNDSKEDKTQFVRAFKADLTQRTGTYRDITYNANTFATDISGYLSSTKPNLIVPMSSSLETLNKIKGPLRSLAETRSATQITLFGYPEWQRYTDVVSDNCIEDFYALNTYIYTPFFANNLSSDIQQFRVKYRYWYNKNMMNQYYPKYALLGYDTGMFFISAIHTYGSNFDNNIQQVLYKSLQNGFHFERVNNWGGFLNTNLYMVHYKKDFTITRTEK